MEADLDSARRLEVRGIRRDYAAWLLDPSNEIELLEGTHLLVEQSPAYLVWQPFTTGEAIPMGFDWTLGSMRHPCPKCENLPTSAGSIDSRFLVR